MVPGSLTSGDASSDDSATATPTPGGQPTPDSPAGELGSGSAAAACGGTTDPAGPPGHSSRYLLTNLAEVVRLYGLRNRVEQGAKQVKSDLGWVDLRIRSDRAIRRRWTLVACAFSFVGRHVLPTTLGNRQRPTRRPSRRPRGQRRPDIGAEPAVRTSWPVALRAVRAWLIPWSVLARCWRSWSPAPPPRQLQWLLEAVAGGQPLHLYLPP